MTLAGRPITEARSGFKTLLNDRGLTVTQGNDCERQETPSLENCLKQVVF